MNRKDEVNEVCLKVFGKVSAAVSHELKNTLSIINENAGLLDDFAAMAEQQGGMEPQRVKTAASTIMRQVSRSNIIIQNLNRYAHSGDSPISQADLDEVLSLVVALTARHAAMKNIKVDYTCPANLKVQTHLLSLESLLYLILCRLYVASAEGSMVHLEAVAVPQGVMIHLDLGCEGFVPEEYHSTEVNVLAEHIGVSLVKEGDKLSLILPLKNNGV